MKYKRIVFKVGTSSLTNEDGSLSRSKVKVITQQLAMLREAGHELILVSMPPVPFDEPAPPAISIISRLMVSIFSKRLAFGSELGFPV